MKVSLYRRWRSSRFGWEWHNYKGVTYLQVWWGHPRIHKWWAMKVYFYLRGA